MKNKQARQQSEMAAACGVVMAGGGSSTGGIIACRTAALARARGASLRASCAARHFSGSGWRGIGIKRRAASAQCTRVAAAFRQIAQRALAATMA